MVRYSRSGDMVFGKFPKAIMWAIEMRDFLNKKFNAKMNVYYSFFEKYGTIYWTADFEDLGALEKLNDQIIMDTEYSKKLSAGAEFFVQGSMCDKVMKAI
jgi:hypothetical protein